jgi:predicted GIY-YIG superfamily endonuclease
MYHYVYYSYEEWGRGYIGSRSCRKRPEEDVKYFGSFYDETFRPTEKVIIAVCDNREEVLQAEIALHEFYQVHKNSHFANRAKQTSVRFDSTFAGYSHSEETKKLLSLKKLGNKNASGKRSEESCQRISNGRKGVKQKPRTPEHCAAISRAKKGQKRNNTWWKCTVSGHVSTPGALTNYQKARGIDPANRVRLSDLSTW